MGRRRTPAEKKRLSYERDRRNVFYESDKTRRKSIPLRKRHRARADRKRASQSLAPGVVPAEIADGDHLDAELLPQRDPRQWQKHPDAPLGEVVLRKLKRRTRQRGTAEQKPRS